MRNTGTTLPWHGASPVVRERMQSWLQSVQGHSDVLQAHLLAHVVARVTSRRGDGQTMHAERRGRDDLENGVATHILLRRPRCRARPIGMLPDHQPNELSRSPLSLSGFSPALGLWPHAHVHAWPNAAQVWRDFVDSAEWSILLILV